MNTHPNKDKENKQHGDTLIGEAIISINKDENQTTVRWRGGRLYYDGITNLFLLQVKAAHDGYSFGYIEPYSLYRNGLYRANIYKRAPRQ